MVNTLDGVGEPIYWVGTEIRFASMLYHEATNYCSWRWETSMVAADEIIGQCYLKPNEAIGQLKDGSTLTGFQLKNLIRNCRIVYQ